MHFRHIYNNTKKYKINSAFKSAIFLFIRNFAYSGMFRYNSKGEFNVPYGGIAYNRKNFLKKIDYLRTKELKSLLDKTIVENLDFEMFLKITSQQKTTSSFLTHHTTVNLAHMQKMNLQKQTKKDLQVI